MGKHLLGSAGDIPQESLRRYEVDGFPICLAHTEDGGFYAIQDTCTHENFSLSEGELWDTEIECPAHGSRFDVRTGDVRFLPAVIPAKTFPVSVESGDLYVDL